MSRKLDPRAIKRARKFRGYEPEKVRTVDITFPRTLICLGDVVAIEYLSDKSVKKLGGRKVRHYKHETGPGVKLYTDPKGKMVLIFGGKFRVTDWLRD